MQLIIHTGGMIRGLYDETIDLSVLGLLSIERASHVEPTPDGRWLADLSPVMGPVLGPFPQRSAALAAETAWLQRHWLEQPLTAGG
jgi:hypothetical protein